MAFGTQPSRNGRSGRRIRLRRKLPRQTSPLLLWLRDERNASAAFVVAGFVAAAAFLTAWSSGLPRGYAGQRAEESHANRLEYTDTDEAATSQRREDARKAAPLVYTSNTDYVERIRGEIEGLPLLVRDKATLDELQPAVVARYGLTQQSFAALRELDQPEEIAQWKEWTDRLMGDLVAGVPIVATADFDAYSTAARRLAVIPPRADVPGDRARTAPLGRGAIELRADDPVALRARLVAEAAEAGGGGAAGAGRPVARARRARAGPGPARPASCR
jgi:hypothetical protein